MLSNIAESLNDPFSYNMEDTRLNKISAKYAFMTLTYYIDTKVTLKTLINVKHNTLNWRNKSLDVHFPTSRSRRALHAELSGLQHAKDVVLTNIRRTFSPRTLGLLVLFPACTICVKLGLLYLYWLMDMTGNNHACLWWFTYVLVPPRPHYISVWVVSPTSFMSQRLLE